MRELFVRHGLDGQARWVEMQTDKNVVGELYRCVADTRGLFVQPALGGLVYDSADAEQPPVIGLHRVVAGDETTLLARRGISLKTICPTTEDTCRTISS